MHIAKFCATLANYYDAAYYVDWEKVIANTTAYANEFALLSELCGHPNIEEAAVELFIQNPNLIRALPILIAYRSSLSIATSPGAADVTHYSFIPDSTPTAALANAKHYAAFLTRSGLSKVLEGIKSVGDYAIGVEVGLDSNARKNRGGTCGVEAIMPSVTKAKETIANLMIADEVSYNDLTHEGFTLPDSCKGLHWDFGFWISGDRDHLAVMEVNHYGSSGSKPPAIAREYTARHVELAAAGIGFIWVTDGLGWRGMINPLRSAFAQIDYLMSIHLASRGQLKFTLRSLLLP